MLIKRNRKVSQPQTGCIRRWRPPIALYIFLSLIALYLGLVIGATTSAGDTIFTVIPKISKTFNSPLKLNIKYAFSENIRITALAVFLLELAVMFYVLLDLTKNRNYMRGAEYGTADWAKIEQINRAFQSEEESCNRIYSNSLRIGMDGDITKINNNVLVIGGSGVGKSLNLLTPNIYQANPDSRWPGSYIFTDPKGELLQKNGAYLRQKGYVVKVLNLVPGMMHESDRFNPFKYIRSETDVITLIDNLFANTTPKDARSSEPFWDKCESMFLQSLFLIVWMEHEHFGWDMNFNTVLMLLNKAKVVKDGTKSPLDVIFDELAYETAGETGKGLNHPAYLAYQKSMDGPPETVRTVIMSANSRLARLQTPEIKRILSDDDLDFASLGSGIVDGKENVKTALFCVIPDVDKTYNFVAGMMYTLLFQELYFQADHIFHGKLKIPVTFWLDEFYNVALPNDFLNMLSTMRSRLISCVIFVQNLKQLEGLYDKEWEIVPGNCDVSVYLGGNEASTFKYISENLGKKTIWKKSQGQSKGAHSSSSTNDDVIGRDLMMPDEVRELDNNYCVVFVRGKKPVLDYKFKTLESPEFKKSKELGVYIHSQQRKLDEDVIISYAAEEEAKWAKRTGNIIELTLDDTMYNTPTFEELRKIVTNNEEKMAERQITVDITDMSLEEILCHPDFVLPDTHMQEVTTGIINGLSDDEIKSYILYQDLGRMRSKRLLFEAMHARKRMLNSGGA